MKICSCHEDLYNSFDWKIKNGYLITTIDSNYVPLHRMIVDAPKGKEVDHINGDRLDNSCSNLRVASVSENQMNRGVPKSNTTGYKGITWREDRGKFQARVQVNGKKINLGVYATPEDAALAYDCAVIQIYGDFAQTNLL